MNKFVHLHLHTEYSLLDGAIRIDKLFNLCKELDMPAVAITDHGNMYGVYDFYQQTEKHKNINAIIGCEFYVCDNMHFKTSANKELNHLVLLAKNNEGYKSLIKLNSISFIEGFYYKPRIDWETLVKHSKGLICLSGCLAGELSQHILNNRMTDAEQLVKKYKNLFGEDYYIELQDHGLAEQKMVLPKLVELARKHGVELVATNDAHYLKKTDSEAQDILMCVQMGKTIDDTDRLKFEGQEFYLKTYEEMSALFPYAPEAISNTVVIANKCNVTIEREELLPNYIPEDGSQPFEYLNRLVNEGLVRRYEEITPQIRQRADMELSVIRDMGFVEYFLIVWDFIHYAEKKKIPVGPGRGSGAGSIVAYSIGITNVDPLKYSLIFERFLNIERISMPDFDIDFCFDRRDEVIDYVRNKYGDGKVAQIITFGTMAAKAAIKDVARVLKIPYSEVDKVTKLIPFGKISLKRLFGLEPLKDGESTVQELTDIYINNPEMRKVIDLAIELEGCPRNTSTHAAGVVICRDDIDNHVPLQCNGPDVTTQFTMSQVEALGLLKMDFLGLRTLTDISKTVALIAENGGGEITFDKCEYDDLKVFELIGSGDTDAVFQLESPGMRRVMRDLQPNRLEDIIAGISLYRPGPMASIPHYINGKRNAANVKYKHPLLEPILNMTYGVIVYQEQVMHIVRELAGFSYAQADIIRKAMGKKNFKLLAAQRKDYIEGSKINCGTRKNGVSDEIANELFDEMSKFAEYGFNKSHAAAYAMVSYQTAYLKQYYPVEFLAAVLNNRITNLEEVTKYVGYCKSRGIEVRQPSINHSQLGFSVAGKAILFGLIAIKGIGEKAMTFILEERKEKGEFKSLADFLQRINSNILNKRLVENLIKAGAFDCFNVSRAHMMCHYEEDMERIAADKRQRENGQFSIFDMLGDTVEMSTAGQTSPEYPTKYKLELEKEVLGVYISGHPLDEFKDILKEFSFNTSFVARLDSDDEEDFDAKDASSNLDGKKVVMGGLLAGVEKRATKAGLSMAQARLEDLHGSIELIFYPKSYEDCKSALNDDSLVTIEGTLAVKAEDKPKIFVRKVTPWKDTEKKVQQTQATLYLKLDGDFENLYSQLIPILESYDGDIKVVLSVGGKARQCPCFVRDCIGIRMELEQLLGAANVIFKYQPVQPRV